MEPAYVPLGRIILDFLQRYHIPDAGKPMGKQREDEHE